MTVATRGSDSGVDEDGQPVSAHAGGGAGKACEVRIVIAFLVCRILT